MNGGKIFSVFSMIILFLFINGCNQPAPKFTIYYKIMPVITAAVDSKAGGSESITQRAEIIKNKLEMSGGKDISVSVDGEFIVIKATTIDPPAAFEHILAMGGGISFNLIDDAYSQKALAWAKSHITSAQLAKALPADIIKFEEDIAVAVKLPDHLEVTFSYILDKADKTLIPKYPLAINKLSSLTNADIDKARLEIDDFGSYAVGFTTSETGKKKFADATSLSNKGKRFAIVVAGKIRSTPVIRSQIHEGSGIITGDFTRKETQDIVAMLEDGALPFSVIIVEKTISKLQ